MCPPPWPLTLPDDMDLDLGRRPGGRLAAVQVPAVPLHPLHSEAGEEPARGVPLQLQAGALAAEEAQHLRPVSAWRGGGLTDPVPLPPYDVGGRQTPAVYPAHQREGRVEAHVDVGTSVYGRHRGWGQYTKSLPDLRRASPMTSSRRTLETSPLSEDPDT